MLKRWNGFTSFLDDGRTCLTNQAAERALRGSALGRKSRLFASTDRIAEPLAFMASLIMTAKPDDIDPKAWLADVLANITNMLIKQDGAIAAVKLDAEDAERPDGIICAPT